MDGAEEDTEPLDNHPYPYQHPQTSRAEAGKQGLNTGLLSRGQPRQDANRPSKKGPQADANKADRRQGGEVGEGGEMRHWQPGARAASVLVMHPADFLAHGKRKKQEQVQSRSREFLSKTPDLAEPEQRAPQSPLRSLKAKPANAGLEFVKGPPKRSEEPAEINPRRFLSPQEKRKGRASWLEDGSSVGDLNHLGLANQASEAADAKSAAFSLQLNLEQIDQAQELLSMNLQTHGFPDCGNLRSTKRRDVRLRLNCLQAMMKQRIKDLEFREQMKAKGKAIEGTQAIALREKLKRHETSLAQVTKEKALFKNKCLEKEAELQKQREQIRNLKQAVKSRDEQVQELKAKHSQELKQVQYQTKVKESQLAEASKHEQVLKEQHRQRDLRDKIVQQVQDNVKMTQTARVLNTEKASNPSDNLHKMVVDGHNRIVKELREENSTLKDILLRTMEALSATVNSALD